MTSRAARIEKAAASLRHSVSDGIRALKISDRRWTNERIGEVVGVGPKTVQRWESLENVIRRRHAEELETQWPEFFPDLMVLLGNLERSKKVDRTQPVVRLGDTIAETYRDAVRVLEAGPTDLDLRIIRHCAFHGDLGDDRHDEDAIPASLGALLQRFGEAMTARILEGWSVRTVFTVGTENRLDDRVMKVTNLQAPAFEVRAFLAGSVPLFAPLIVGDIAFIATDHQRWNRAEAAIRFEGNTSLLLWVHRYFDMIWDRAPYRIRTIVGPDKAEIDRLRSDLRDSLSLQLRPRVG